MLVKTPTSAFGVIKTSMPHFLKINILRFGAMIPVQIIDLQLHVIFRNFPLLPQPYHNFV
jgi:hypothetical protein